MSLEEATQEARSMEERRQHAGVDQSALDTAAASGFSNGLFEDQEEDIPAVLEEFYSSSDEEPDGAVKASPSQPVPDQAASLQGRLRNRANVMARA
jgi:hypothetical protein